MKTFLLWYVLGYDDGCVAYVLGQLELAGFFAGTVDETCERINIVLQLNARSRFGMCWDCTYGFRGHASTADDVWLEDVYAAQPAFRSNGGYHA